MYIESQCAKYTVFRFEKRSASAFVRAFGDVISFRFRDFEIGLVEEGRWKGGEVCVDVYDAARGFRVRGEFGGEVDGGGGDLLNISSA
jgi:hypothetical protein